MLRPESTADEGTPASAAAIAGLVHRVRAHPRPVVLTGAGVSAPSGIPTYRDDNGDWRRSDPIQHQAFVSDAASRRRYWARSMTGWRFVRDARPNPAHRALVELERRGHVRLLITQNVDRLHQRAGHRRVVDLHGRLDRVICLGCSEGRSRRQLQRDLEALNPDFDTRAFRVLPDGDAEVEDRFLEGFRFPECGSCGGTLMPDVVFFGGTVPRDRFERAETAIESADALLIAGSSMMVFSGYRFARLAAECGMPIIIVNRGRTRADDLADLKIHGDCTDVFPALLEAL